MARPYVVFHWRDNNDKRAEVKAYLSGGQDYAATATQAVAVAGLLQAVSDARITSCELVFPLDYTPSATAGPDSSVSRYALLFYRNDSRTTSIRLPSPQGLPTEVAGAYAGIRVTRELLDLSGLLGAVESLPEGLVDSLGRPMGTAFSVGGIVRL